MDERTEEDLLPLAQKGDKDAQYSLGHYYGFGSRLGFDFDEIDGVRADVYWYQRAAENGHSEAQYTLGQYYRRGIGVQKNPKQARYWYGKAAEQGHERARITVKRHKT